MSLSQIPTRMPLPRPLLVLLLPTLLSPNLPNTHTLVRSNFTPPLRRRVRRHPLLLSICWWRGSHGSHCITMVVGAGVAVAGAVVGSVGVGDVGCVGVGEVWVRMVEG
jgi:hypothetical protein